MGEAAPPHQSILRHLGERGEDPGMDSHERLRLDRNPAKANESGAFQPLADFAGFEPDVFRENAGEFAISA